MMRFLLVFMFSTFTFYSNSAEVLCTVSTYTHHHTSNPALLYANTYKLSKIDDNSYNGEIRIARDYFGTKTMKISLKVEGKRIVGKGVYFKNDQPSGGSIEFGSDITDENSSDIIKDTTEDGVNLTCRYVKSEFVLEEFSKNKEYSCQ